MVFDFEKTRIEATARRNVLISRIQEIPKEKARLDEELQQIQVEMIALDQILEGLSYMETGGPPPDFEELGFRGQIEKILQLHVPKYLLPTEIREKLGAAGITGSTPRNLLISIHTILSRLDKDKLIETTEQNGRTAYKWKGPIDPYLQIAYSLKPNPALVGLASSAAPPNEGRGLTAQRKTADQKLAEGIGAIVAAEKTRTDKK
ncbi:MAG TPA: hypothetical protein VKV30_13235 [Candidatus Angelobacter sp.]|nr:hypothetical protein [Candidatus Angelobacter sp.]